MPSSRRWACLIAAILEISACVDACSYVLVGKHAAADNAVLASYQNDYTGNTPIAVVPYMTKSPKKATQVKNQCSRAVIPPVPRGGTYASYAVTTPSIREAFLNSAGLAMNYGVYNYVRSEVTAADGFQVSFSAKTDQSFG